jgi:hypothetical protein
MAAPDWFLAAAFTQDDWDSIPVDLQVTEERHVTQQGVAAINARLGTNYCTSALFQPRNNLVVDGHLTTDIYRAGNFTLRLVADNLNIQNSQLQSQPIRGTRNAGGTDFRYSWSGLSCSVAIGSLPGYQRMQDAQLAAGDLRQVKIFCLSTGTAIPDQLLVDYDNYVAGMYD